MTDSNNNRSIRAARTASSLTQEDAAKIIGVSVPTYCAREKLPKSFSVDEIEDLFAAFDGSGKKIVQDFMREIFLL